MLTGNMLTWYIQMLEFLQFFFDFWLGIDTQCYYYNKHYYLFFLYHVFQGWEQDKFSDTQLVTYVTALLPVFYYIASMQRMILVACERNGHQVQPGLKAGVAAEVNQVTHGLILPSSEKLPGWRSHSFAGQCFAAVVARGQISWHLAACACHPLPFHCLP